MFGVYLYAVCWGYRHVVEEGTGGNLQGRSLNLLKSARRTTGIRGGDFRGEGLAFGTGQQLNVNGLNTKRNADCLRRSAPAKEQAEGNADAKPDREQLQDIRAAQSLKVRVIETIDEWRERQRQNEEGGKPQPLLPPVCCGFHGEQA